MDEKEVRSTALDLALTYLATIRNPEGTLKTKPEEVEVIAERFVAFINKK